MILNCHYYLHYNYYHLKWCYYKLTILITKFMLGDNILTQFSPALMKNTQKPTKQKDFA